MCAVIHVCGAESTVQRAAADTMIASVSPRSESCDASLQERIRCTVLSLDNIFYIFSSLSASRARGRGKVLLFHLFAWMFCVSRFCFASLLSFSLSVVDSVSFRSTLWSVVLVSVLVFCYRLVFLAVFVLSASVLSSFQRSFATLDGFLVSLVTLSLVRPSFYPFWSHFKSLCGCFASCTSAPQVHLTPYLPSGPAPLDSYIT